MVRLDRFVSQATGMSRSQARDLIRRGGIEVDGVVCRQAAFQLGGDQSVVHQGQALHLPESLYLMLNKPRGLLSANSDGRQATVMTLFPPALARRLHLVGRLDKDTSGLLLLTDDGAWSHRIASPVHACAKTYRAELAQPLCADAEQRLAAGLSLRSETRPTRPAEIERLGLQTVRITITEGRYHQVRRMFAALGNRVTALHRESVGGLVLDAALAPGQWRSLSAAERDALADVAR